MNKCKICNENLYQNITFANIFYINYSVHTECINKLTFNNDSLTFPIEGNIVHFDYLFYEIDSRFDINYLEFQYLSILLQRNMINNNWSILIYYFKGIFDGFSAIDFTILFSLANSPILIISLEYFDLLEILGDNL